MSAIADGIALIRSLVDSPDPADLEEQVRDIDNARRELATSATQTSTVQDRTLTFDEGSRRRPQVDPDAPTIEDRSPPPAQDTLSPPAQATSESNRLSKTALAVGVMTTVLDRLARQGHDQAHQLVWNNRAVLGLILLAGAHCGLTALVLVVLVAQAVLR